jgi:hypothetical protein
VATAFILRTTRVVEAAPEPPDYPAYPEAARRSGASSRLRLVSSELTLTP